MTRKAHRILGFTLTAALGIGIGAIGTSVAQAGPKANLPQIDPNTGPAHTINKNDPKAPQNGNSNGWIKGRLSGIDTDAQGRIQTVGIEDGKGGMSGKGCGAKIANLPHFANHHNERVAIRVKSNGCIDRYATTR